MSDTLLKRIQILIDCEPSQCLTTQCPNYNEEENKCIYVQVLWTFSTVLKEKFKDRNKEEE